MKKLKSFLNFSLIFPIAGFAFFYLFQPQYFKIDFLTPHFKVALPPTVDPVSNSINIQLFRTKLENILGSKVDLYFSDNVENFQKLFEAEKIDFGFLNLPEYLYASEKFNYSAILSEVRYDNLWQSSRIFINENDPNLSLQSLNGNTFAFVHQRSLTGYIVPKAILIKNNIKIEKEFFTYNSIRSINSVASGMAYAAAIGSDIPAIVANQSKTTRKLQRYKKSHSKLSKLQEIYESEKFPYKPYVVHRSVKNEKRLQLQQGLVDYFMTNEGRTVIDDLFNIRGLHPISDQDYDALRESMKLINLSPAEIAKPRNNI